MRRLSRKESFSRFSIQGDPDDCWEWKGLIDSIGYGVFCAEGKRHKAHRYAYAAAFMSEQYPPTGLVVMHKCDNMKCCNPKHLILGTQLENIADRKAKGRTVTRMKPGAEHPSAKLKDADVLAIRASREPWKALMARYSISKSLVCQIKNGTIWTHLNGCSEHQDFNASARAEMRLSR